MPRLSAVGISGLQAGEDVNREIILGVDGVGMESDSLSDFTLKISCFLRDRSVGVRGEDRFGLRGFRAARDLPSSHRSSSILSPSLWIGLDGCTIFVEFAFDAPDLEMRVRQRLASTIHGRFVLARLGREQALWANINCSDVDAERLAESFLSILIDAQERDFLEYNSSYSAYSSTG